MRSLVNRSPFRASNAAGAGILLLLGLVSKSSAQTALTDWRTGIATHYGGAQDGMDPYSPSFGTSVVSSDISCLRIAGYT